MEISFNCQYCDAFISVSDGHAGKNIQCPECGLNVAVPEESGERQYVIAKPEGKIGPIKFIDMADMVNKGNLKGGDKVAIFGADQFKPVKQYEEFSGLVKIALKKGTKKSTIALTKTFIKLGAVLGLIICFFWAKTWWDDRKVAKVQAKIYKHLDKKNRRALSDAVKEYEIMKKEFSDSKRTEQTKKRIEITRKTIVKKELEEYEKIMKTVDRLEAEALKHAKQNRFSQAYRFAAKVRGEAQKCRSIRILRKAQYRDEYNDIRSRYRRLGEKIDAIRKAYVDERLEHVNALIASGDFDTAKDILFGLSKMDLPSHLARIVTKKMTEVSRKSRGDKVVQKVKKKKKPKDIQRSGDVIDDLKSRNAARRKKAFEIIATTGKKPEGDANEIFFAAAEEAFESKDLYFPALDAVLVVGDSGGRMFRKIFENYHKHTGGGKNRRGMGLIPRDAEVFAKDLAQYICKHGGMDKGVFLAGLMEDSNLAPGILATLPGNVEIKDMPNLRRGIEKIVIYSKNGPLVKTAIIALGKLKSRESLDMLVKIVDHTTCSKCSFGGKTSGHMYNYTNLFCARCREPRGYFGKGSIFYVTLQAIQSIGSQKPLQTLRKLKDREDAAGHKGTADLIGGIIEDITTSK